MSTLPMLRPMARQSLVLVVALLTACAGADTPVAPVVPVPPPAPEPLPPGTLVLVVNGLPVGTNADVSVTGSSFSRTATASVTWSNLAAGRYTVTVRAARGVEGTFTADTATFSAEVLAGGPPSVVSIQYRALPSALVLQLTGVPGGAAAPVRVRSPSGDTIAVAASRVLTDSARGVWRVLADTLVFGGARYAPTPSAFEAAALHGDTATATVDFAVASGALALSFTGLPDGVSAESRVNGPGGYVQTVNGTTTLTELAPGTYRVVTTARLVNGVHYRPSPDTLLRTVTASLVAEPVIVHYRAQVGQLSITTTGLPEGAAAGITVAGAAATHSVSGDSTLSALPSGLYTVTALPLTFEAVRYVPTSASFSVTVNTGDSIALSIAYVVVPTVVEVVFAGLPANAAASAVLTSPVNTDTTLAGTTRINPAMAGRWRLSVADVTLNGSIWKPLQATFDSTVNPGDTLRFVVVLATTGPNFAIEQLHITQATQRFDGSIPLVANRDALLRVFVSANKANTARPPVRVRVYDGATLLHTVMIPAPEASVRQSLSPAVLSSSWNMIVPASHMRPGLRVIAELDPQATLQEVDRSDNVWPRGGSPKSVVTYNVPAFRVRFIPVVVGALTGSVSSANSGAFLHSARLMFPLNNISADVRAPFTSSATELQSNDGNGNWLTVLSEINALRATDTAPGNMHYYGVVATSYNSGVAGYGYLPGRAAIGWDKMPSGDGVAAHEWGHNFGVLHAPCGTAGDPRYPYPDADIGQVGWNSMSNVLVQPNAKDLMSYCSNNWISDFTWSAVMQYRGTSSMLASSRSATGANGTPTDALLVWGRVVDGRITLEPAFRVRAPLSANVQGTHRLELLDDSGARIAEVGVVASRVDHVEGRDERHFAVVLPFTNDVAEQLASIRVRDIRSPLLSATRSSVVRAQLAAQERAEARTQPSARRNTQQERAAAASRVTDPAVKLDAVSPKATRVSWTNSTYNMGLVRDAQSGAILGFVRRSGHTVMTDGRAVEVVFSDGVRSEVHR